MKTIIVGLLMFVFSAGAIAADTPKKKMCPETRGSDLTFPKGEKLEITEWKPETKTYKAISEKFPDERIMDVTLEGLADVIPQIKKDYDVNFKKPENLVGEIFVPTNEVKVLDEDELEARRGCVRK